MNDQWGLSVAIDDGKAIEVNEDPGDSGIKSKSLPFFFYQVACVEANHPLYSSPLPTPRPTPTDGGFSSPHHKPAESQAHPHVPVTSATIGSSTPSSMQLRDSSIYSVANDSNGHSSIISNSPRHDSLHNLAPYDFSPFPSSQPQPHPQLQSQQSHFSSPMVTHPYQGQHAPLLSTTQMSMGIPQGDINALSMTNSLGMGLNMGPMNVNPLNFGSMHAMHPNTLSVATLMDVMRYQNNVQNNVQGWGGQGQQGMPASMPQNGLATLHQNQLGGDQHLFQDFAGSTPSQMNNGVASIPMSSGHMPSTPPSSQPQRSVEPPSSQLPSPSIPRRRSRSRSSGSGKRLSSVKRETRSVKRARHKIGGQSSQRHRRRRSPTPSTESDDSTPDSIHISPVRTPPPRTQPPPTGSPRKAGEIFRSESGSPLSFFVQVDLKKRLEVIQKIKVQYICSS
jgi:hypothetical protein